MQENELIKYAEKPRESDFTTIQMNPIQLVEVRKAQEEPGEMFREGMGKISLLMDMFKSIGSKETSDEHNDNEERPNGTVRGEPEKD